MSLNVKYRTWYKGEPPRPIRLEIPGWAGSDRNHSSGAEPQPWHCPPFVEGSTYGYELIYPFKNECVVTRRNGAVLFEGDFSSEDWSIGEDATHPSGTKKTTPPFLSFAKGHYGMSSSLDMEPPEGYVIRTEPHPRFYTDETGTVPCMLAGHIQRWWSRIFFVVFKAPREGETQIFRPGDPYGQVLFVPQKMSFTFERFTHEEVAKRESRDRKISNYGSKIATNVWKDSKGLQFDNKYKTLSSAYAKGGYEDVDSTIDKKAATPELYTIKTKIPKRLFKNEKLSNKKKKEQGQNGTA